MRKRRDELVSSQDFIPRNPDIWAETSSSLRRVEVARRRIPTVVQSVAESLLAIWFFTAPTASGEWRQQQFQTEASSASGVVHLHVVMRDSAIGDDATLELAKFS